MGGSRTGYDVVAGEYVDMIAHGVMDPLKVVKTALLDAASVSSHMLTVEAMVVGKSSKRLQPDSMAGADAHMSNIYG